MLGDSRNQRGIEVIATRTDRVALRGKPIHHPAETKELGRKMNNLAGTRFVFMYPVVEKVLYESFADTTLVWFRPL